MPIDEFMDEVFRRHHAALSAGFPPTEKMCAFSTGLLNWLFPAHSGKRINTRAELEEGLDAIRRCLVELLTDIQPATGKDPAVLADIFFSRLPQLSRMLEKDAAAILEGDPAATCLYEVIRTYPGFYALAFYRIAHILHNLEIPVFPRVITEFAHTRTGIDIHPGARIGEYCCIDHGTGVVIGETTVIGAHVKIYQGVTLGALSVEKEMARQKRHPTIEDHVVIYAGTTILGGETTIGHHSIIGGNVWLIRTVPPYSRIYYKADENITFSDQLL